MGVYLSNRRYEEIKRIVVDMFLRYGVSCVPVNGFELATKMGISVIPYSAIKKAKHSLLFRKAKMVFVLKKKKMNGIFTIMIQKIMAE